MSAIASPPSAYRSRREFLARAGSGCGLLALAALLDSQGLLVSSSDAASAGDVRINPMAPKPTHFPAKARSVIQTRKVWSSSCQTELSVMELNSFVNVSDMSGTEYIGCTHASS